MEDRNEIFEEKDGKTSTDNIRNSTYKDKLDGIRNNDETNIRRQIIVGKSNGKAQKDVDEEWKSYLERRGVHLIKIGLLMQGRMK